MSEPIVYVDTSEIRPGKLEQLEPAMKELAAFVEANEPRIISYNVYFNPDATRMTVMHVHPDSASLEFHMKVAGPLFPKFAEFITLLAIDVYGAPSDAVLVQLRQKAEMLGTGTVQVHGRHAGFARLPISARVDGPRVGVLEFGRPGTGHPEDAMPKDVYEIGEVPPIGTVPKRMVAQVIRPERFGDPVKAFQVEEIEVPEVGPDDALVLVMAAGINYNNVWAARGIPVDVCKVHARYGEPSDFHIGGSDASGIVYKVGANVTNVKVGDRVVIHCGAWDVNAPEIAGGLDPMFHDSFRIWGYETNWGSFAQFTKVQAHQCVPKAPHLTWEEAAAPTLVGATAYRMLFGWPPHDVKPGDAVLVWGGAGGLGSMAIQLAVNAGATVVAVVSSEDKFEHCRRLGATGVINRKDFDHWGMLPHWTDNEAFGTWFEGAKKFGKAFWEALGAKRAPRIVFEHPGESTIPTSIFLCDTGGMVVICAGTSGYNAVVDLRYLWMRQKRFQGSHFANDGQAYAFNDLVVAGKIDPCLARTFSFEEIGECHQLMFENRHPEGNMAALVTATAPGQKEVDL